MTDAGDTPWRWTGRGLLRAGFIAAVAVSTGAALGTLVAREPPPRSAGPSAAPRVGDASLTWLAPLHEGSVLEGYDVAEIHPVGDDGVLLLVCKKARATVRLRVGLAAPIVDGGTAPAVVVGPYAVAFARENAAPGDAERLAAALAAILRASAAPPPPRLGPLGPERR